MERGARAALLLLIAASLYGLAAPPEALALRCGTALVSVGDTTSEVRDRCGAAAQEETWRVDLLGTPSGPPSAPSPTLAVHRDGEWIYNFGPRELLQAVAFRDGRVVRLESLGPGVAEDRPDPDRCRSGLFTPGDPRLIVAALCGPPSEVRSRTDRRTRSRFGRRERTHLRIEEWVYDFGPRFFVRTYVFHNGRLDRIESGDRGGS